MSHDPQTCPGCSLILNAYKQEPDTIAIPDDACPPSKLGLEWMRETKAGTVKAWEQQRQQTRAGQDDGS